MSFLPQIFKSVQPIASTGIAPGTNTASQVITAVNLSYAAIQWQGSSGGDLSGGYSGTNDLVWSFVDSTHVKWDRGYSNVGVDKSADVYGTVLEFLPNFLRQAVAVFFNNATFAHGLTLGPKAYIIHAGQYSNLASPGGGDSSAIVGACRINGANIEFSLQGGANVRGYIIDPV